MPVELKNAPWGEARPNGLRVVWLLEPRALKYRIGTPLRSVILFHNAGKSSVVFRALTFNQSGSHKASDANGADINISSVEWTTIPRVIACRLAPGESIEMTAPGIGVGARNKDDEDWRGIRVGSWIDAKVGDEVTFTPSPVSASGQEQDEPLDEAQLNKPLKWWLDFITDRLSLDLPLPADAAERGRILKRATRDLFGNEPTAEEVTAFTIDAAPDALGRLAKRLAQRPGFAPFSGSLTSGTRKFLVLSADPDAATKPRTANNPGRYTLGDHTRLVVTRRPIGERIVNEARIEFYSPDSIKPAPGEPHEIKLPDGYDTWSAAWMRGETVLWVQQKGTVRSYDFTNPAVVKETVIEDPTLGDKVPQPILDALRAALDVPVEPKPATTETSPPDGLEFLKPYPKLHGLSYEMTEKQFLEIAKQQGLKPHRSPEAKNPRYEIGTGDGHTVIVMFGNKGEKCSGIQRVRGDLAPPSDESISLTDSVRDFNDENKQLAIGQDQPPMSADEAVAAIKQSKWEVDPDRINQQEIAAFKAVAESRRLPKGSYFQVRTGDQHETFLVRHYWLIELYLPAIGHDGFVGFTIRDTKLNDEKIDPKLIAWGKPDADGLSLGAYLSPKKETYQLGERIRLRLFVRNDSQQQVETTWMNSSHPLPEDFTITDESGAQVAVRIGHESWDHAWVSGTRTGGIAPGEAHAFFVPYEIRIGGGAAKEANKLIGRVIEARAGQTLQLRVRSHNGNHRKRADNEPEPESGIVAFKVIEPTAAAAITK